MAAIARRVIAARKIGAGITCRVVAGGPTPRYAGRMQSAPATAGRIVRSWRDRRGISQLALATEARISQKHLSFIESGRAAPSRDMVVHLAEVLDMPLRERNALLLAAGYAPLYKDRPLTDPALTHARAGVERLLAAHAPFPALVLDRRWSIVAANASVAPLLAGVDPALLAPPVNVMRVSLHPRGLAPLIVNFAQWRAHLLERLRRQLRVAPDAEVASLLTEVEAYAPPGLRLPRQDAGEFQEVAVPLRLRTHAGVLSFLSTVTVFGTAVDITLAELSVEAFFPEDEATEVALRGGTSAPRLAT